MSRLLPTLRSFFWLLVLSLLPLYLLAQSSSESPYSDQAFADDNNPSWYQTPFLWIGLLLFGGVIIYLLFGRKKSDTNTPPKY